LDGPRSQVGRVCDARREPVREAYVLDSVRRHARDVPFEAGQGQFAPEFLRECFQALVERRDLLVYWCFLRLCWKLSPQSVSERSLEMMMISPGNFLKLREIDP
jgi:hypothetical protein